MLKQLAHELDIIERADLAGYFLMVWDIIRYRKRPVCAAKRGSAANSIVAYLLGITSIDPLQHNLLFERFLSTDKFTTPDIDIDFAADRREEVIQYVYRRYGRPHGHGLQHGHLLRPQRHPRAGRRPRLPRAGHRPPARRHRHPRTHRRRRPTRSPIPR
ncbi:MAG: hypothetical protein R2851_26730 [Caldilineaceae bacterium]